MSDYFIHYTESNMVCLIIFGILLVHDLRNTDRQEKQIKYDRALVAFMLYFISDSFWAAVVSGVLPATKFTVVATNFANFIIMVVITYTWLRFVMAVEQVPHRDRPINRFVALLPFVANTIALIAAYIIAPEVLITDSLETTLVYDAFQIVVPDIYIVAVLFYTMGKAKAEENPIERRKHFYIGFFPLMVIGCGLLQILVLPNSSIFCFSCTILMLIFHIQSMEAQISLDPLTELNNRGQLLRYVSQELDTHRDDESTFVVMIDVNEFKSINDTYGHAEGDRALIILADSLRQVVKNRSTPIFLGRYGGDEFVLIVHQLSTSELDELIAEIRKTIVTRCVEDETPYVISVGVGYDKLMSDPDTFQKCMQRADHKLYLDKEQCKLNGETTICS